MKKKVESFFSWFYGYDYNIFVIPIVAIILLIVLYAYNYNVLVQKGVENYNNGICRECGEALEYKGSSRNQYSRYDYYICPNGHVVEVCKG